jgi:hypothetical protein
MTKYFEEQNKIEKMRQQKADLPIAISGEKFTKEEKPRYYCNNCQFLMVKVSESEWFCNHCKSSAYPEVEQLRSKSRLSAPNERNTAALISYSPEPDDLSKKPVEPKGGFAELKKRGIRVTSYSEGVG